MQLELLARVALAALATSGLSQEQWRALASSQPQPVPDPYHQRHGKAQISKEPPWVQSPAPRNLVASQERDQNQKRQEQETTLKRMQRQPPQRLQGQRHIQLYVLVQAPSAPGQVDFEEAWSPVDVLTPFANSS